MTLRLILTIAASSFIGGFVGAFLVTLALR